MSSSSYGTAQFTISGNAGSTTEVKIVRRTTPFNDNGAIFVTKATGSQDISGYASDGGTEYYAAYNYNRHSEQSTASNQISWTRPTKNVEKTWRGNDAGQAYYFADYTYVIPTNGCEPYRLSYLFGSSGIPDSDDAPGYARVDYMTATFKCGIKPTGYSSFDRLSLCNTSNLRFSYATVGSEATQSAARPTGVFGDTDPLGSSDKSLFRFAISLGGSSLHNKVFWATSTAGKSWNIGTGSCVLSTVGDYWTGKLFELVGVVTTSGSGTGF
jgi:hypothetical protein